ncbi:MAG TPA: deoxyguanosinetriphosphate triphosphohydrolase, partial [Verrucomicrobiae bacterium]|nr:deoxyguanosinetriphosphate triphosphohydrolase [Verrucomicrobiae bacterium]
YLYKNLYYNPVVHQPNLRAVKMLEELFNHFLKHPQEIGENSQKRLKEIGLHRAVCDYLAGMTDRYVMLEYQRIFGKEVKF